MVDPVQDAPPLTQPVPWNALRLWLLAATIFLVAFGLRAAFLHNSPDRDWPHSAWYEGDAPIWVVYAGAIKRGEPFEADLPLYAPGVAWLLAALSSTPDGPVPPFYAMKIVWSFFTAASCAFAALAAARCFGLLAGWIAGVLSALSFGSYVLSTSLNNEAPYLFLLMLMVVGSIRWLERPSWFFAIGLGVLHGLATLFRPEHTLLLLLLAAFALFALRPASPESPRRSPLAIMAMILLMGVLSVIVCLPTSIKGTRATIAYNNTRIAPPTQHAPHVPWTQDGDAFFNSLPAFARDQNKPYIEHIAQQRGVMQIDANTARDIFIKEFGSVPEPLATPTFVSSQGPLCFALANHPESQGGFSKKALDPRFQEDPNLHLPLPSHLRLYNDGYAVGWEYITADFNAWLQLVAKKFARFSDGVTLGLGSQNLPYGYGGVREPIDLITPGDAPVLGSITASVWQVFLLAVILIGCVSAAFRRTTAVFLLIVLYKLIITAMFFGYARQAVSIGPVFFILAAAGSVRAFEPLLRSEVVRRAALVAVSVLLAALLTLDIIASFRPRPLMQVTSEFAHEVNQTPHWGQNAFTTFARIRLKPAPALPPTPEKQDAGIP